MGFADQRCSQVGVAEALNGSGLISASGSPLRISKASKQNNRSYQSSVCCV